ncbi:MAG: hypothetical protein ACLPX9_00365 [Rhodomicrobium sp.]
MFSLAGKKACVLSIANDLPIADCCARAFRDQGSAIAVIYLNDKAKAFVQPLAERLGATTMAASGIGDSGGLLERAAERAPTRRLAPSSRLAPTRRSWPAAKLQLSAAACTTSTAAITV